MSNAIITENQNTGTSAWQPTKGSLIQIHGYASASSVDPGGSLTLYISTQVAGTGYRIDFYRLGYYQGLGATLKLSVPGQVGVAQGYYDGSTLLLNNCPTAVSDSATHLLEARWASSYVLNVPSDWVTGVYLAMLTDVNGFQSYIVFVVRGNSSADYAVVRPFTTDQAYNAWGGNSLYVSNSFGNVAATKVSFERPIHDNFGSAGALIYEMPCIKWLEKQGYNLSYLSSVDVHANAATLLTHNAYLSIGHDEYWSKEMRDGVEAAIAGNVGAAFCGANCCYWQIRFENSGLGVANRTITCYKVGTIGALPYSNDPFFGADNTRLTTNWRDTLLRRPENTMIGIMYSGSSQDPALNVAWTVGASANSSYLTGTGLVAGNSYGTDVVGYEWDKVWAGGPSNLQILGSTATVPHGGGNDTSNTTVYIATSGVLVFATGSICWTWALDSYRYPTSTGIPVPQMQVLMTNIMTALIRPLNQTSFSSFAMHQ